MPEEGMFDQETVNIVRRVAFRRGLYLGLPLGASAALVLCLLISIAFHLWWGYC